MISFLDFSLISIIRGLKIIIVVIVFRHGRVHFRLFRLIDQYLDLLITGGQFLNVDQQSNELGLGGLTDTCDQRSTFIVFVFSNCDRIISRDFGLGKQNA